MVLKEGNTTFFFGLELNKDPGSLQLLSGSGPKPLSAWMMVRLSWMVQLFKVSMPLDTVYLELLGAWILPSL